MHQPRVTVTQLYVYPVKSCAGTALESAEIGPRGIAHDREFMVIDPAGDFLTQREVPRLALIQPRLEEGGVSLAAPNMPTLRVHKRAGATRPVSIWADRVTADDQGDEVADWLSTYLGQPCRLVGSSDQGVRPVSARYAVGPNDQVSFADGYPVLIVSEESLDDLNARLETPLPMNRFRPSIVVGGWGVPFGEDTWSEVTIGDVRARLVKACARCVITTTDQATAERAAEPLVTLARYRRISRGVIFGQNAIPVSFGRVRLGQVVGVVAGAQRADEILM